MNTMKEQRKAIKSLFSRENIEYSIIFIFLSIIFFYYFRGPLLDIYSKTEIAKEISSPIIIPSNVGEFLYWLIFASVFTPYITFIYKRKYEIFFLGFFIPSLIVYIYTFLTVGIHLDAIYIEWSFWNLISCFTLICLLRRSVTFKEDLVSIVFFVSLNEILFLLVLTYLTDYHPSSDLLSYITFTFFASAYLILLLFAVEKIAKVKIFRHMKVLKEVNKNE